ncbi:MAG: ABC transporter permease [Candidatus Eremiobacteraeota bacterium]|nr:ABC transporter permease [Candidatus Eremiobacteraeota bacterium]
MSRIIAYGGEAFRSIWLNRTRSILTMLGMIIGTSSVIAVLGISHAASSGINSQISAFGVPPVQVTVDENQDDPAAAALQYRDLVAIGEATTGLVTEAEPFYNADYQLQANKIHSVESVQSASGFHTDRLTMRAGRRINDDDVAGGAHVMTLSADLAEKFFPGGGALGNFMNVNGTRFGVVGVYDPIKGSLFNAGGANTFAQIPYSTFHRMQPGPVTAIIFYPDTPAKTDDASTAVVAVLQHVHGVRSKYTTQNFAAVAGGFETVINIIAAGLTAIGGVALIVAGIGIMNIMLVSVTERTREIGIRKAIGAGARDIVLQFLMEALLLSLGGGLAGMILGILLTVGLVSVVSQTLGEVIIPYLLVVSVAMGFSIAVGMVFGLYPAIRASRMDPIEALRS